MRPNRRTGYLALATIIAVTSTAAAQEKTADKADNPKPEQVAQAQPDPANPANPAETSPAPVTPTPPAEPPPPAAAAAPPPKPALEFGGYARAGVGLAVRGGKQVCFGLPGADTKWRLGNECDYVIEPQFTYRFVQLDDKSSWGVVVMPGLYRTWADPNGPDKTWMDNIPAVFRQIYFFGENIPQLANGRVWGGRRYYDRLHLDINDQFLEINDSDGAGVEEMQLGFGKLSVAFLMNPNTEAAQVPNPTMGGPAISTANLARFQIDGRLTDIKTMPEGALQFWTAFAAYSTSKDQLDTGVVIPKPDSFFRFAAYHTLNKVLGGSNLVGAKVEIGSNHLLWRAVVQQQMLFNHDHTGVDVIGEFRSDRNRANGDADWVTNNWLSLGARADTQISGPFRFLFEAGIDHVFPDMGDDLQLIKATACLAINAGFVPGARPTFRLFYTHAFWNDAAKGILGGNGPQVNQIYGDKTNGGTAGIQAEAWW